ncbi:MAG: FAD-dependent oxidoreductase [Deltaproteobacteria bacterium]|nr:FAD-dependent oxidoreductase [Deltaproteobacteria bacterium]
MKPKKEFDMLILGGGPAGMTAAVFAARANFRTAVIESNICGGLVNSTHAVENFPSYESIHGMELMQRIAEQVQALGVTVEEVAEVTGLYLREDLKEIETEECLYRSPVVILATGRRPVSLEIETGGWNQIHYCSVCDGSAYKDKRVLVVGGGNSGFDEAFYLLSLKVKEIRLIEKMDRFFATEAAQSKLLSHRNVTATSSTEVVELVGDDRLRGVRLKNNSNGRMETVNVDGIFVFMGQIPNTTSFADIIALDEQRYVLTDENMATNIDGVYAVGDVRQKQYRYITTAMADGTIAALSAERYIRK